MGQTGPGPDSKGEGFGFGGASSPVQGLSKIEKNEGSELGWPAYNIEVRVWCCGLSAGLSILF